MENLSKRYFCSFMDKQSLFFNMLLSTITHCTCILDIWWTHCLPMTQVHLSHNFHAYSIQVHLYKTQVTKQREPPAVDKISTGYFTFEMDWNYVSVTIHSQKLVASLSVRVGKKWLKTTRDHYGRWRLEEWQGDGENKHELGRKAEPWLWAFK